MRRFLISIIGLVSFIGCASSPQPTPRQYNSVEGRAMEREGSHYKGKQMNDSPEGRAVEAMTEATISTATDVYGVRLYGKCQVKFKGDPFGVDCRNVLFQVQDERGQVIKKTQTNHEGKIEVVVPREDGLYTLVPESSRFGVEADSGNEVRPGESAVIILFEK